MLLCGVSGGADSVALLHLLAMLRETHDFSLAAVHVEHGVRGESSLTDAAFVRELCEKLNVHLYAHTVSVKEAMESLHCGMEEAARILRYDCFRKVMKEAAADALLLAHHADDQAETVLMHLLRGSGPSGLCGMEACIPFENGILVRPLLGFRHETLCLGLEEAGLFWREDETNAEPSGFRNALRLSVMPLLERLSPGCIPAIGRTAHLLAGEESYWRTETADWLAHHSRITREFAFLDRVALMEKPPAYQRRVLRAFSETAACAMEQRLDPDMAVLSFDKTEELLNCLVGNGGIAVNLPGGIRGERSRQRLHLIPSGKQTAIPAVALNFSGNTCFEGFSFHASPWQPLLSLGDGVRRQALDADMLSGAVIRTRRPGDFVKLLGAEGKKPLKEFLIERHVDRPFRDKLPLIAKGSEILWVPGVGPAGGAAITPETSHVLFLTFLGCLPWQMPDNIQQ